MTGPTDERLRGAWSDDMRRQSDVRSIVVDANGVRGGYRSSRSATSVRTASTVFQLRAVEVRPRVRSR